MKHTIDHELGRALALKATRHALESYQQQLPQYDPQAEWVSEDTAEVQFTVLGKTLEGSVQVRSEQVTLELQIPFVFRAFKNIAVDVVEGEIEKWLERARRGELDDEE